jgi:trimeric autotransporter adhesin
MNPLIQVKKTIPLFLLVLACLALSPQAPAVCQQGCDLTNDNTFLGDDALLNNTTGDRNTAIGFQALFSNTSGGANTATGFTALFSNTTGDANTATGDRALFSNTTGDGNTATGVTALESNTTGDGNTATGIQALQTNTAGNDNTATGFLVLNSNTSGSFNTATGSDALVSNTTGFRNTANGANALTFNTTGYRNTANGYQALYFNTIGSRNTAEGYQALFHNIGSDNVGLGFDAGSNLTTGSGNVCIGNGVLGLAGESNITRIRNIYASVASGRAVYVNSDNKIGTLSSSRRYKEEIKPMDKASETLFALKPVIFRYKKEVDAARALSFGLIAEDVAEISPELITRDEQGNPQTVRYEAVNAMLLNEFLKEHRKVEEQSRKIQEQDVTITQFKKEIQTIAARLKEQDSKIQKVSARLEMQTAPAQTVANSK